MWHNKKTERDTRDWRGWRGEVGNPIWPRRAFPACLALHAPQVLEGFFSILLGRSLSGRQGNATG